MTSANLAISFLKQTPLPENQLRIFLSYLPQELLKEYLSHSQIYKGKTNRSKHYLIDVINTEKDKSKPLTSDDDNLSLKDANKSLNNNDFGKPKRLNKPANL